MSTLLPERWKESLERVSDKIGHFLERRGSDKKDSLGLEQITAEQLPVFMQFGGPLLDMHESGHELVVRAEVPGLKKDDISVELVGKRLTIHGAKQITRERKGAEGLSFTESKYGSFNRSVLLPFTADEETIQADLKHGVLTIRLPKPEAERSNRIKVPVL